MIPKPPGRPRSTSGHCQTCCLQVSTPRLRPSTPHHTRGLSVRPEVWQAPCLSWGHNPRQETSFKAQKIPPPPSGFLAAWAQELLFPQGRQNGALPTGMAAGQRMGRPSPSQAGASRQPRSQAASKGPGEARGRPSFLPAALRGVVSEQSHSRLACPEPRAAWPGLGRPARGAVGADSAAVALMEASLLTINSGNKRGPGTSLTSSGTPRAPMCTCAGGCLAVRRC